MQGSFRHRSRSLVGHEEERTVSQPSFICERMLVILLLYCTHRILRSDGFPAHSLDWYRFIGRILGKALYEGILVDIAFAGFFLAKVIFFESLRRQKNMTDLFLVARETEFLGRSRIFGLGVIQRPVVFKELHGEPRRSLFDMCSRRRR